MSLEDIESLLRQERACVGEAIEAAEEAARKIEQATWLRSQGATALVASPDLRVARERLREAIMWLRRWSG